MAQELCHDGLFEDGDRFAGREVPGFEPRSPSEAMRLRGGCALRPTAFAAAWPEPGAAQPEGPVAMARIRCRAASRSPKAG